MVGEAEEGEEGERAEEVPRLIQEPENFQNHAAPLTDRP